MRAIYANRKTSWIMQWKLGQLVEGCRAEVDVLPFWRLGVLHCSYGVSGFQVELNWKNCSDCYGKHPTAKT